MKPPPAPSPLPWKVHHKRGHRYWIFDANGNEVCILYSDDDKAKANASLIFKAVNSYAPLWEMVGELTKALEKIAEDDCCYASNEYATCCDENNTECPWIIAKAVLAKAQAEVKK